MKDESAGLLAAAFIGIAPGYISRSVAGSYDNEAIAIFLLMFTFYSWIKALKTGSAFFGTLTALFYFYMVAAWGQYYSQSVRIVRVECNIRRPACMHPCRSWVTGWFGYYASARAILLNCYNDTRPHMFSCRRLCVYYEHDPSSCFDPDPHGSFQQPSVRRVLLLVRDRYLVQYASPVRRLPTCANERTYGRTR